MAQTGRNKAKLSIDEKLAILQSSQYTVNNAIDGLIIRFGNQLIEVNQIGFEPMFYYHLADSEGHPVACGIETERSLSELFDRLPLTSLSIPPIQQDPFMKLTPIPEACCERLMTLRWADDRMPDIASPRYDFFPAGMTLNLALESIERRYGKTLLELAQDAARPLGEGSGNEEDDAIKAIAFLVISLREGASKATSASIISGLAALTPFTTQNMMRRLPANYTVDAALAGKPGTETGGICCIFDALYHSLIDFPIESIKRCPLCGRVFFADHGKQQYCSFNCPGEQYDFARADGVPCYAGVKKISDADRDKYQRKNKHYYDYIIQTIREGVSGKDPEWVQKTISEMTGDFLHEYDQKRGELFCDTKDRCRFHPWEKHERMHDWLLEYGKQVRSDLEELRQ